MQCETNGHESCFRYQRRAFPLLKSEDEKAIRELLNDVTIVNLDEEIKKSAIRFRRDYRLKLPDALIVATAFNLNAELFTNDIKLLNVTELNVKTLALHSVF
jgi:predicted nucleic acid-binding protein